MIDPPLPTEYSDLEINHPHFGSEPAAYFISYAAECLAQYTALIEPLRKVARRLGYALAVHGSLAKDIDLIAVPWTNEAVDAEVLVVAFTNLVRAFNGLGNHQGGEHDLKPHGRRAWVISLPGGTYIDLSVMPKIDVIEE